MRALLMHRDEDLDLVRELPPNEEALTRDLELNTLFDAMALGDEFLHGVIKRAVLTSLTDTEEIVFRQQVLADSLEQAAIVRKIYDITVEAIAGERKIWRSVTSPDGLLHTSVQAMELFVGVLKSLRAVADNHAAAFRSDGFVRLFAMLSEELDDEYFRTIEGHLKELTFQRGVMISAQLGRGNKGIHHVLRRPPRPQGWIERMTGKTRAGYSFQIADRDENGFKALSELRGKGINLVADALAQSADHILSFIGTLRAELAFYVGCLNVYAQLTEKGEPTCVPVPLARGHTSLTARGLYDPCLALNLTGRVVGNDVTAENKSLVMITGANQGGKSTFLRSLGLAQLMMQSGMFVAADSFRADVRDAVFTHFKREEDATMQTGKLAEELSRMSAIADQITPDCVLLCNESFAATNEREGSEIARQVLRAFMEGGIKTFFVTHLFDLANGLYVQEHDAALFLRAERQPDGRRTFRLSEGEPLPTSFGGDSYRRIFGAAAEEAPAASADAGT